MILVPGECLDSNQGVGICYRNYSKEIIMRVGLPSVPRNLYPKPTSHTGQWVRRIAEPNRPKSQHTAIEALVLDGDIPRPCTVDCDIRLGEEILDADL
jgi:hypothetical protein